MTDEKPQEPDPFGEAMKVFYGQVFSWNSDAGPIFYSSIQCDPLQWVPPTETTAEFYARRLDEVYPW